METPNYIPAPVCFRVSQTVNSKLFAQCKFYPICKKTKRANKPRRYANPSKSQSVRHFQTSKLDRKTIVCGCKTLEAFKHIVSPARIRPNALTTCFQKQTRSLTRSRLGDNPHATCFGGGLSSLSFRNYQIVRDQPIVVNFQRA